MHRRLLLPLLLLLPVVALVGVFVYEQLPTWSLPTWMQPTHPDAVAGACEARATLALYDAGFTSAPALTSAPDGTAARAAAAAALPALEPASFDTAFVTGTFGGVPRDAVFALLTYAPDDARLAKAAVVYTDTQTGDVLALHVLAAAPDPAEQCGVVVSRRALVRLYAPLIAAAGYLVLLAAAGGGVALWRRTRRAKS